MPVTQWKYMRQRRMYHFNTFIPISHSSLLASPDMEKAKYRYWYAINQITSRQCLPLYCYWILMRWNETLSHIKVSKQEENMQHMHSYLEYPTEWLWYKYTLPAWHASQNQQICQWPWDCDVLMTSLLGDSGHRVRRECDVVKKRNKCLHFQLHLSGLSTVSDINLVGAAVPW